MKLSLSGLVASAFPQGIPLPSLFPQILRVNVGPSHSCMTAVSVAPRLKTLLTFLIFKLELFRFYYLEIEFEV